MSRLTAMYSLPGGFWKISRNQNHTDKRGNMHSSDHIIHVIIKRTGKTEYSSPNLVSFATLETLKLFL